MNVDINPIKELQEGPIRNWYEGSNERCAHFIRVYSKFVSTGYLLDKKGGVLTRPVSIEEQVNFKIDDVPQEYRNEVSDKVKDVVFLRKTDLHYRTNVTEIIKVLSGAGYLYKQKGQWGDYEQLTLKEGQLVVIPKNISHCFTPANFDHIELRIALTDTIEKEEEVIIKRFDEWTEKDIQ